MKVINNVIYDNLEQLKAYLTSNQKKALYDATRGDYFKAGSAVNGVFGLLFGNAVNPNAISAKETLGFETDSDSGVSTLESFWKENPGFALLSIMYMNDMVSIETLYEDFPSSSSSNGSSKEIEELELRLKSLQVKYNELSDNVNRGVSDMIDYYGDEFVEDKYPTLYKSFNPILED